MARWLWLMGKSCVTSLSQFLYLLFFYFLSQANMDLSRAFLNEFISFVGIGLTLYAVGQVYTYFSDDVVIKRTVKCRYCRKWISSKVRIHVIQCLPYIESWLIVGLRQYDASIVLVGWMEGKTKYAADAEV